MEYLIIIGVVWFIYSFFNKNRKNNQYHTPISPPPYKPFTSPPKLNEKTVELSGIKLSNEQQKLIDILEQSNEDVFITGKAGTGKSLLLKYFKQKSSKKLVVCAPTGVAALNVGGQTIHSLFKIPPSFIRQGSIHLDYKTATLLKNIDAVVIDEISMVRADLMDAIDESLRQARHNDLPFGGVQIIMFGDLYQLPPVVSDPELHKYFADNHNGFYFFNASVWKKTKLNIYELSHIFRQNDDEFKEVLNAVRVGDITESLLVKINQRAEVEIPENNIVTLATTNKTVSDINNYQLERLPGEVKEYNAIISGNLEESSFPTEENLRLKVGAQVMLIKNDKEKRWVNGTIGKISSISNNEIKVNIDGIIYPVSQENWNKIRYYYDQEKHKVEEEVVSSFIQYPLRLAWAITVHKSQGKTYGSVIVDMGDGAFAHGQTYVALSRCKTLDGLYLKRSIKKEDIIVDSSVVNFMSQATILES